MEEIKQTDEFLNSEEIQFKARLLLIAEDTLQQKEKDDLTNWIKSNLSKGNCLPLNANQYQILLSISFNILISFCQSPKCLNKDQIQKCLILLDSNQFLNQVIQNQLESKNLSLKLENGEIERFDFLNLLSIILLYTPQMNFSIVKFIMENFNNKYSVFEVLINENIVKGQQSKLLEGLKVLFRLYYTQPSLLRDSNITSQALLSSIKFLMKINVEDTKFSENNQVLLIKWISNYLVSFIENGNRKKNVLDKILENTNDTSLELFDAEKRLLFAQWVDNEIKLVYRNNHAQVEQYKQKLESSCGQIEIDLIFPKNSSNIIDQDGLIHTKYLQAKLNTTLQKMQENIFQHFLIQGGDCSGKLSYILQLKNQQHELKNQDFIVVTIEESFDAKNLVGTYVCNDTGEFVFKKGPLTVAAEKGMWLILKNIEKSPPDLLTFLLPLVQSNQLKITSNFEIFPKLGFRIFALLSSQNEETFGSIKPLIQNLELIKIDHLREREDFDEIIEQKYPFISNIRWLREMLVKCIQNIEQKIIKFRGHMLDSIQYSIHHLFRLFSRVESNLKSKINLDEIKNARFENDNQYFYLSSQQIQGIILDIIDIYLSQIYSSQVVQMLVESLMNEIINPFLQDIQFATIDSIYINDLIQNLGRDHGVNEQSFYFGRSQPIQRNQIQQNVHSSVSSSEQKFVYTAATQRLIEQICVSLESQESILLVGETGTGKTTSVQEIAKLQNKNLHVFNLNQNTDSSDLLGGFKPVDLQFLLKPIYTLFLKIFKNLFQSGKNQNFLDLIQKCFEKQQLKEFIQCLQHGYQSIQDKIQKNKNNNQNEQMKDIEKLGKMIQDLKKRQLKLEQNGGFIFQFIEGALIKSIQNGDWILLDEINLANDSVLNKLATIIEGDHILLNERADIVETKRHKDFRIFMCMNPPYTSAGKKQLPQTLRQKLNEIYVQELTSEIDLWPIVDQNAPMTMFTEQQRRLILKFYLQVRVEIHKYNIRGNIGLRNLSRAMKMMRQAIQLRYPVVKVIYDSLMTCFSSHLDNQMQTLIHNLIFNLFQIKQLPVLDFDSRMKGQDQSLYAQVQDFVIQKGQFQPQNFDQNDFILTGSFKKLVNRLASIVAVSDYAVILEGPTSAGKTSTVQYLANVTHNKVIRINNHMHTDIQEYLGSYVPAQQADEGKNQGKLIFQEGVLVEAVRNGYWVILDELNLAPSEVLEALNRLLDDNRELNIVETQTTIKAHPNFRIFATQNPTEGYGGRKELSQAFMNRFILIRVQDVPTDELQDILIQKCGLPKSRAELMVKAMENLQIYRSQESLFSGKNSTITVRDLLKWAERVSSSQKGLSISDVANEGFLVLGERSRNPQDKEFIRNTIQKTLKCQINPDQIYDEYFKDQNLEQAFKEIPLLKGIPSLIITQNLKRLAVLVHKCLQNKEPVLLVGETGCGKTSLCQVFAAIYNQQLFSINCHLNTETSDFIGCMRTKKNLSQIQDILKNEILQAVDFLQKINVEIKESDIVLINNIQNLKKSSQILLKILKSESNNENKEIKEKYKIIKKLQNELTMVFEWNDGILVESMEKGGLLLIDEISLANDSVLERLNSVFEKQRVLTLSEKSSTEAIKIIAHSSFNIVATMNPSGDFGKKELSPALRNRMTEIWVESYFNQNILTSLYSNDLKHQNSGYHSIYKEIEQLQGIDLFQIINDLIIKRLGPSELILNNEELLQQISISLFNIIGFTNFELSRRYPVMQRKSISIRDITNCVEFMNLSLTLFSGSQNHSIELTIANALFHSVQLVILDGLCLGIDVSGDKQKFKILDESQKYLQKIIFEMIFKNDQFDYSTLFKCDFVNNSKFIGVEPFLLEKYQNQNQDSQFAFDANTTKSNLHRLLRAFLLQKPILVEGPPGVGKTSLIENLAKSAGRQLHRVNLSEQTDMMDLLGSEYPVSCSQNANDQQKNEDDEDIQFRWCDGVLLKAIKEGHWFLIDEMNLAQQSVLEGLNAILDHRKTVYIPELNQEFKCHPNFFLFACQNPSQSSSSVGGRKSLPKSFLNRFNKIYLEELTQLDYLCIVDRQIQNDVYLGNLDTTKLLKMALDFQNFIKQNKCKSFQMDVESENQVNLRDLNRFLKIYKNLMKETQGNRDLALAQSVDICFLQQIVQQKRDLATNSIFLNSGLIQDVNIVLNCLQSHPIISITQQNCLVFESFIKTKIGQTFENEEAFCTSQIEIHNLISLQGPHSKQLELITQCIQTNLPILIVTNNCQKAIENLETLCFFYMRDQPTRMILTNRSDTSQLLGCFEQTASADDDINLQGYKTKFQWVDSLLIQSLIQGKWTIFENANLCPASILDRLNGLFEEGNGQIILNEQGVVFENQEDNYSLRVVQSNQNFRAIFVIDEKSLIDGGRDISRALRNRCIQTRLYYNQEIDQQQESKIFSEKEELQIISKNEQLTQEYREVMIDPYYSQVKYFLSPFQGEQSRVQEQQEQEVGQIVLGKRTKQQQQVWHKNDIIEYESNRLHKYSLYQLFKYLSEFNPQRDYMDIILKSIQNQEVKIATNLHYKNILTINKQNPVIQTIIYLSNKMKNEFDQLLQKHNIGSQLTNMSIHILQFIHSQLELLNNNKNDLEYDTNINAFFSIYILLLHVFDQDNDLLNSNEQIEKYKMESFINRINAKLSDEFTLYILCQNLDMKIQEFSNVQSQLREIHGDLIFNAIVQGKCKLQQLKLLETIQKRFYDSNTIKWVQKEQDKHQMLQNGPFKNLWIQNIMKQDNLIIDNPDFLFDNFTLILLNDDKEIIKQKDIDQWKIQDLIINKSAYLIIVPKDDLATIMVSSSKLFPILCLLKDFTMTLNVINNDSIEYPNHKSNLQALTYTPMNQIPSKIPHFVSLMSLEDMWEDRNQNYTIAIHAITQILEDEKSNICLRDMPSYYQCSKQTLNLMKNIASNQYFQLFDHDYKLNNTIFLQNILGKDQIFEDNEPNQLKQNLERGFEQNQNLTDIINQVCQSFKILSENCVVEIIEAMLLLPLEIKRISEERDIILTHEYLGQLSYFSFFLQDLNITEKETNNSKSKVIQLQKYMDHLITLMPQFDDGQSQQYLLRNQLCQLLRVLTEILKHIQILNDQLHGTNLHDPTQILQTLKVVKYTENLIRNLVIQSQQFLRFGNIIQTGNFIQNVIALTFCIRQYYLIVLEQESKLKQRYIGDIQYSTLINSYSIQSLQGCKEAIKINQNQNDSILLYENQMLWMLKTNRLIKSRSNVLNNQQIEANVHIVDYFVHRDITHKLSEEQKLDDQEEQILRLPFKMKMQDILEENKAIDERTAKDKHKMQVEAAKEIEINFPSYFDEIQDQLLKLSSTDVDKIMNVPARDQLLNFKPQNVESQQIFAELTEAIQTEGEAVYRTDWLRKRLQCVALELQNNDTVMLSNHDVLKVSQMLQSFYEGQKEWINDAVICLDDQIQKSQIKSVMNISSVELPKTYNFYIDSNPTEARLFYQPLADLQQRVRNILEEYESPILNDLLFLTNYMLISFNTQTPLMKMLTGMELLLEKLDEWDAYSSKRLNSCHEQTQSIKQLIIRYRKIQILSWRSLLDHKRLKMIREDFPNCIRLIHTIERQVFDEKLYTYQKPQTGRKKVKIFEEDQTELEILQIADLFIRDSSLGIFESRLKVIEILYQNMLFKQALMINKNFRSDLVKMQAYKKDVRDKILLRLQKVLNILSFVIGYYEQFKPKLGRTIARLDVQAREKIKTLIDISKWTLQKFTQVKSNIDKTHRQLNKACKLEEEILIQNIQSLILTSSRKKYIFTDAGGDKLISLDSEKIEILQTIQLSIAQPKNIDNNQFTQILSQLQYFEQKQIKEKWPDTGVIEIAMEGFFDRMKHARDLDKKHIQRKAFTDLLKFMKDQGLKPNFQDKLQPLILNTQLVKFGNEKLFKKLEKYFYKAHELLIMIESSSQIDENSDLRNIDIIRIQGFSQSLMEQILVLNKNLEEIRKIALLLDQTQSRCNVFKHILKDNKNQLSQINNLDKDISSKLIAESIQNNIQRCPQFYNQIKEIDQRFVNLKINITERLNILLKLENKAIIDEKQESDQNIHFNSEIYLKIVNFKTYLLNVKTQNSESQRIQSMINSSLKYLQDLIDEIQQQEQQIEIQNKQQNKIEIESQKIIKLVQLVYQNAFQLLNEQIQQQKDKNNDSDKDSADGNQNSTLAEANSNQPEPQQYNIDLNIVEHSEFTQEFSDRSLKQIIDSKLKQITVLQQILKSSNKLFEFKGINNDYVFTEQEIDQILLVKQIIEKLKETLDFVIEKQACYLTSLCKFSYVSQRVFLYLIYQGFCGKEDKDENKEDQNKDDEYLDGEGCGMGDGQGQNNVSNQIEHEEQLEGLKNYESDMEQEEQPKEEGDEEKDDNDFEMQEDFDGDLEDEKKEEKKSDDEESDSKEDDADDALDQVDDMLDNELWDQNMQDMQDKEDENQDEQDKNKENREIDLGERELDKQNQVDQQKEKELTQGDHDKQNKEDQNELEDPQSGESEIDDQMKEQSDQNEEKEEKSVDEEMADNIPLNKPELIEDDQNQEEEDNSKESVEDIDQEQLDKMDSVNDEEEQKELEKENNQLDDQAQADEDMEENSVNQDDDSDNEVNSKIDEAEQIGGDDDENSDKNNDENSNAESDGEDNGKNNQQQNQSNNQKKKAQDNLNQKNKQPQNNNKQNQQTEQKESLDDQEFDVNGNDILFQIQQRIEQNIQQQQEKEKKEKSNERMPEKKDDQLKNIQQPQMVDDQQMKNQNENKDAKESEALEQEYQFDDEKADQLQGNLAADNVENAEMFDQEDEKNQQNKNGESKKIIEEEKNNNQENSDHEMQDENIQKTEQQITQNSLNSKQQKKQNQQKNKIENIEQNDENDQIDEQDLVDQYQQFLNLKKNQENLENLVDQHNQDENKLFEKLNEDNEKLKKAQEKKKITGIFQDIFDYEKERMKIKQIFEYWKNEDDQKIQYDQAIQLLSKFKQETVQASSSLCEQLRIVLEPQLSQQLQGDFKTGKRLNMKKVISFIASNYRNDKIWLRRTLPSKRDYKILIAIDDSLSMQEQNLGFFSLEAMVTLVEALNRLEIGKVGVARIRDRMELLQSFEDSYSNERTAFNVSQFQFDHCAQQSHDFAMANFIRDCNKLFDLQNSCSQLQGNTCCPFVIILSDGRFNKNNVNKFIQEAVEKKYLYIFVILDSVKQVKALNSIDDNENNQQSAQNGNDQASIYNLRSAIKNENGKGIKLEPYLKDFPFTYYCIVRDLHQLPNSLAQILVQWFSMVSSGNIQS